MNAVRQLLAQRHLATLICAAALALKLLVPTGYMIASDRGRPTIILCAGAVPVAASATMSGMHAAMPDHRQPKDHGKPEMPCAFAGLSAAALGVIDPVQLAALIAFVLALGWAAAILPRPQRPPHLRPPPRGPPVGR